MTSICLDLLLIRIYPSSLSQPFVRVGEGFDIVRELFHMAEVSQMYPGRASMSPLLDVFITLVGLGASGWKKLREDRKTVMTWSPLLLSIPVCAAPRNASRASQKSFRITLESGRRPSAVVS